MSSPPQMSLHNPSHPHDETEAITDLRVNEHTTDSINNDQSDMNRINDSDTLFAINTHQDNLDVVNAVLKVKEMDSVDKDNDSDTPRKRPRRAASKKATENLSKYISFEGVSEDKSVDNNDNSKLQARSSKIINTQVNNGTAKKKPMRNMDITTMFGVKKDKVLKTKTNKKKLDDDNDGDEDFIMISSESEKDSEAELEVEPETSAADELKDDDYIGEKLQRHLQNTETSMEPSDDFIEETEPKFKKKRGGKSPSGRVPKKSKSTPKPKPAPKIKSILAVKKRLIRTLKDVGAARDKIERLYGSEPDVLLSLAKIKEGFERHLFDFRESNIDNESKYYVNIEPICNLYEINKTQFSGRTTEYWTIDEKISQEMFNFRDSPLKIMIENQVTPLNTNEKVEFPKFDGDINREGFVYNVGGLVTDMAWLNFETEDKPRQVQYLIVAVSQYKDDPTDPKLKMFDRESHVSCFQLFEFHPDNTLKFIKIQTIFHNFGDTWNLKWHEGYRDNENNNLGLLGFTAQDGSVKFIEIQNTNPEDAPLISMCETPLLSISLQDSNITCFDFFSPTTIVCGFKNGYVAEFDIFDPDNIPSYYYRMSDSYISTIVVSYFSYTNPAVSVVGADGYIYLYDPRDMIGTKCIIARIRGTNAIPMTYCSQMSLICFSDGYNNLRACTPMASFAAHSTIPRETTITALGAARFHPMILTGTANGTIYIENIARKILTGSKNSTTIHKTLRLWRWEYDASSSKYRLDHTYEAIKAVQGEVNKLDIQHPGISISAVKWNETKAGCKFYAFSNNAGLLTIERLPLE